MNVYVVLGVSFDYNDYYYYLKKKDVVIVD